MKPTLKQTKSKEPEFDRDCKDILAVADTLSKLIEELEDVYMNINHNFMTNSVSLCNAAVGYLKMVKEVGLDEAMKRERPEDVANFKKWLTLYLGIARTFRYYLLKEPTYESGFKLCKEFADNMVKRGFFDEGKNPFYKTDDVDDKRQ